MQQQRPDPLDNASKKAEPVNSISLTKTLRHPSQPQKKTRNMKHEPPEAERPGPLRNHIADEYSLATTNEIAAAGVHKCIYLPTTIHPVERCGGPFWVICK